MTLAYAPFDQWWLAVLCPMVLMLLWRRAETRRDGAWLGFLFGLGLYGAGTWWLYISIRIFGQAPIWVAVLVMVSLVAIMAAYQALLGYAVVRWLAPRKPIGALLLIPAAWIVIEWWRGWFLSGFPWLSLGYSQTDSWLVGLAPVGGVHLLSLLLLTTAGALLVLARGSQSERALALVVLVLPWTTGLSLRTVEWTQAVGAHRSVAVLQAAIPQDMKWLLSNQKKILDDYAALHREALGAQLIVWPESALPDLANYYPDYIKAVWSAAETNGSNVLMGIMRQADGTRSDNAVYYNSVLALGEQSAAFYDKHHLVPFGEYFPVPQFVRNWLRLMSLPYDDFTPGARYQAPVQVSGMRVAPNICYEDAYPGQLRRATREAQLLVTVTNDAWFGKSSARYQHLQIARMRAAESRRYLVRAANDGVSAIVDPYGQIAAQAPEFSPAVLRARVQPRQGDTPYLRTGNLLIIGLASVVLAGAWLVHLRRSGAAPRKAH
jgi:apolipoprotein N-acyltransferase